MTRKTITLTTAAIIVTAALSTAAMAHGTAGGHSGPAQATMQASQGAGQGKGQSMGNTGPGAQGVNMMFVAMRSMMNDHDSNKPLDKPLTIGDVQTQLKQYLQHRGNDRLKIGEVTKLDDKTITAQIVTKDGSVVEQFKIDKTTGRWSRDNK